MEGPAQLETLQLLLFLLPPCHSDTLLRLLRFLAEVARHAESSWDPQGHQVRLLQGSCWGNVLGLLCWSCASLGGGLGRTQTLHRTPGSAWLGKVGR